MTVDVRPETAADIAAIHAVHRAAFPGVQEAGLVDTLREDGDLILSLVAERDGAIVGHVAFSRMRVENEDGTHRAVALAPVGVKLEHQRKGVGTALIEHGVSALRRAGETLVFVLGEPDYYGRFGFDYDAAAQFTSPFPKPYFQSLALTDRAPRSGLVHYAAAFSALT